MKSKLSNVLIVLALFVGLSLILYPMVSDYINAKHQSRAIQSYEKTVNEDLTEDRIAQMFEKAYDYNRRLNATSGSFYHPETVDGYMNTLDVTGTGIMGYITIEKIGVELPIYHTVAESILQVAAGHIPGTALPVGGEGNHAVLAGHRGLPSAKLFTDLNKLEEGDIFTVTILNQVFMYKIDQVLTVLPTDGEDLQPVAGKDYCTLVTCTPYGINSHRLLVRGERIEPDVEKPVLYIANEAYQIDPIIVTPAVAAPMLLILAIVLIVQSIKKSVRDRKKKKALEDAGGSKEEKTDEIQTPEEGNSGEDPENITADQGEEEK